ncbi:MAG: hypothetical protein IKQ91_07420 [Oscillospiraceae bacterium]|nr:hypothetical protein [Oscillospiraceae bacterium]
MDELAYPIIICILLKLTDLQMMMPARQSLPFGQNVQMCNENLALLPKRKKALAIFAKL